MLLCHQLDDITSLVSTKAVMATVTASSDSVIPIIIVGGGIGGLAAAVACTKVGSALAIHCEQECHIQPCAGTGDARPAVQVGIPVVVLEKGYALRQEGASINIGTDVAQHVLQHARLRTNRCHTTWTAA